MDPFGAIGLGLRIHPASSVVAAAPIREVKRHFG